MKNEIAAAWKHWIGLAAGMAVFFVAVLSLELIGERITLSDWLAVSVIVAVLVGSVALAIAAGVIKASASQVKVQEARFASRLDDEYAALAPVPGCPKGLGLTPGWLIARTPFLFRAYRREGISALQRDAAKGSRLALRIRDDRGKEQLFSLAAADAGQAMASLDDWRGPAAEPAAPMADREPVHSAGMPLRDLAKMMIATVLAIGLCTGFFYLYRQAHPIKSAAEASAGSPAIAIEDLRAAIRKYSSYGSQLDPYLAKLSLAEGDDSAIRVSMDQDGQKYTFWVSNDSDYFWSGTISLTASQDPISEIYPFMVTPHSYQASQKELAKEPDAWTISESCFARLDYSEPEGSFAGYQSIDEASEYYMMYAAAGRYVSYDNFRKLAKRQYAINLLSGYDGESVYLIDSDAHQMAQYDGYQEYPPAEASFRARLDLKGQTVTIYELNNGAAKERETIDMAREG